MDGRKDEWMDSGLSEVFNKNDSQLCRAFTEITWWVILAYIG